MRSGGRRVVRGDYNYVFYQLNWWLAMVLPPAPVRDPAGLLEKLP